jgi:hypothetical protein
MPNDNPQMPRHPALAPRHPMLSPFHSALSSRHPRAGTSSPSVYVGDGRRFTNSEAGHPDTMPVSRSRNCCHPERSEGSRSSPHRHVPRRDASAVGLSMTTENCHSALSPRHPRAGGDPDTMPISRSRNCRHPERSEGSRSSHHRHAPRRDASAVGLSMTIEGCHPEHCCHSERSEGSRCSHHRHTPRRDASAVGLSMTTEGCHPEHCCHSERSEGSRSAFLACCPEPRTGIVMRPVGIPT